jgi:hypothetical protein
MNFNLNNMLKSELIKYGKFNDIELKKRWTKDEMISTLQTSLNGINFILPFDLNNEIYKLAETPLVEVFNNNLQEIIVKINSEQEFTAIIHILKQKDYISEFEDLDQLKINENFVINYWVKPVIRFNSPERWDDRLPSRMRPQYSRELGKLFRVVKKPINFSVPHTVRKVQPYNNDCFNIMIWSHYETETLPTPLTLRSVWGIPLHCKDSPYPSSIDLLTVKYEGVALAELDPSLNNLYILFDITHYSHSDEVKLFSKIIDEVIKLLQNVSLEAIQQYLDNRKEIEHKELPSKLFKVLKDVKDGDIDTLKRDLGSCENYIKEYRERYIANLDKHQKIQRELLAFKDELKFSLEKISDQVSKLLTSNKITNISIQGNNLCVATNTIYCKHDDNIYLIGKFEISFNLKSRSSESIRFKNQTQLVEAYESDMHAPHVFGSGKACFGSVEETLLILMRNYEYDSIIYMCIRFLETVNIDDSAGRHIAKWPVVSQEDYEKEISERG